MSSTVQNQSELQRTFVAMLFAFAVSVVAQQIAELLIVATGNWTFASAESGRPLTIDALWMLLSVASHIVLALLMLCVSWIMWSRTRAAGSLGDLTEVFSVKFITFLVEILLVTLYYALSKSAEGDFTAYNKDKDIYSFVAHASVRPEAIQMFSIFVIFALWDYIVDVATSAKNPPASGFLPKFRDHITGIATYCFVSMICASGAIAMYFAAPVVQSPAQAFWGDIGLIALLLFFNQGKTLEHYIFSIFPSEETRSNTKKMPTPRSNALLLLLTLSYVSCLLASSLTLCTPK